MESSPSPPHPFFTYTSEVLAWRLGSASRAGTRPDPDPVQVAVWAERIRRSASHHDRVVLLGIGSGALADSLARTLPPEQPFTVVSLDPDATRQAMAAGRLTFAGPTPGRHVLVDASEQAIFSLLTLTGHTAASSLLSLSPEETSSEERQGLARLRRLLLAATPAAAPTLAATQPTLAVLAREEEPDLPGFFQAAARLARRCVVLWDAEHVPQSANRAIPPSLSVTHQARRLDGDFAAQRNALLAACPPGWVLSLDPDERPGPGFEQAVATALGTEGLGGVFFPRLTLYPDAEHAKVGYGLWPDLQLRLFRNDPPNGPRYVRPIHERLEGLSGPTAVAFTAPLLHLNRLVKNERFVTDKLSAFSQAPGAPKHRLSADYPSLPRDFFTRLTATAPLSGLLLLPGP